MKAPTFWKRDSGSIWPTILEPISFLYRAADAVNRRLTRTHSVGIPVICIGNIIAGGAGKTPVALAVARYLMSEGWNVHFLSRGYGGKAEGPVRVVQDVHKAADVGDEPLLLAAVAPTWVAKDRVKGAEAAVKAGADVLVMDDGFQNFSLHKDISILVVDAGFGVGNGRVLPAGPMRETVDSALSRADAVVTIGNGPGLALPEGASILSFRAKLVPKAMMNELVGEKVVAFAGIGRPAKFFESLMDAGAELVEAVEFPDHHAFTQEDIMKLVEKAALHDAALVTTRKDYVRLPDDAKLMTTAFDVELVFQKPADLQKLFTRRLGEHEDA
ncbi:tetraacyldisaccharide 4'-kinase [Sneathiella chinensis]|uniref:Tetraacyldisaccharide 4'-kinase n=1 Tax=Sneathiella chinensis TaxID=349750 RepID=A0ABQ5U6H2_9PROT|nr:tetraacyldisaccharide 4'-kinase [Sneathiella chinensis]GLQ07717.1 tetraacyldisaccharide 4'-kinase [Sneathiella chinensis]